MWMPFALTCWLQVQAGEDDGQTRRRYRFEVGSSWVVQQLVAVGGTLGVAAKNTEWLRRAYIDDRCFDHRMQP